MPEAHEQAWSDALAQEHLDMFVGLAGVTEILGVALVLRRPDADWFAERTMHMLVGRLRA